MANGKKIRSPLVGGPISPEQFEVFLGALAKELIMAIGLRSAKQVFFLALKTLGVSEDAANKRLIMYLHDSSHTDLERMDRFRPDL